MALQNKRAEFTRKGAETLAKRAAYMCSFPGCDQTTTGPGVRDGTVSTTGKASHIFSAREGGPRGTGGLSFEQRQDIDNGIWLCAHHADEIDKDNGVGYPASTLHAFRRVHEERIRSERGAISGATGWIHCLSVQCAPVFRTPFEIQFGKVTVLHGGNGSGKTALCDWLQGISDPSALSQWTTARTSRGLSFEVTYLDPFKRKLKVRAKSSDEVEYFVNGQPEPFDPSPIRFVRLQRLAQGEFGSARMTDLEFLSKTLSVNPALVRNMLPLVGINQRSTVFGVRLESGPNDSLRVWTEVDGTWPGLDLQGQLSNTERCRVLLEIAAAFARQSAKRVPTVLLVDWAAKSFDSE
jgi:energy-coupling factor transporter ATP-binding protein EcfA2